ncbi:MAG: DNA primase [Anaerolineaceae bacterium]|nr:DNA primase [Anaerolineaceae bacterium]
MSSIDEVKARLDIVDIVSETVKLRRTGKNYIGFCPFHQNSRTPAFVVFPDSGTWRCFGECNEGGDLFKYVMKKEGWDFPTALRTLAQRAGVELESLTPQKREEEEKYDRLRKILEEALTFFHQQLLKTSPGKEALDFLHKRGLTNETIELFGLGYAPDSYHALLDHLTPKGFSQEDMLLAGLLTERQEGGGAYDRFRHRVMFPIRDGAGRMSGFGARILRPDDIPKFLNSPQTPVFDKGRLLYGFDLARKPIRAKDQVVIVEGYLDVILLHQAGYTNTVSPMGTALTEDQVRMLKRLTRRIVLALDADAAGEKATLRGLEVTRQAMDHSPEFDAMKYNPRGLIAYEGRLQADVRITTLPPGMDPDEVVLQDPKEWGNILEGAQPVVIHVMETLAAGKNIDDPKVKSEIASQVLKLIEDVPDAVERDAYRQRLARLLRVDERALVSARPAAGRTTRRSPVGDKKPAGEGKAAPRLQVHPGRAMESHCLGILMVEPELAYSADRALQAAGLMRISLQDFQQADMQILIRLVLDSLDQDQLEPTQHILQHIPEDLMALYDEMKAPIIKQNISQDKLVENLVRTLIHLRLEQVNEGMRQLRFLQEGMEDQEESTSLLQDQMLQFVKVRARLDQALARPPQID